MPHHVSRQRQRHALLEGWLFHRGELAEPPGRGAPKAGACGGVSDRTLDELSNRERGDWEVSIAELEARLDIPPPSVASPAAGLDGWEEVRLPHDWRIEQAPMADGPAWQAFSPGGVAYYRLRRPALDWVEGLRTVIEFDGVMRDATVWCNGFLVGDHLSGYTGFRYDLTELLRYGDEGDNILLVRCDTTSPEGWWYEGGGIYREVALIRHSEVHVDFDGVWVTTPSVTAERATVQVVSTVRNQSPEFATIAVTTRLGADTATETVTIEAGATADVRAEFVVATPALWDIGRGHLYTVVTEAGEDRAEATFGIRSIDVRGADGVLVNGERVRLRGANLHQDFAGLGVALPDRVVEHKLRLLQQLGCNAVRSAHHPPSRAFLAAADRLGLLVIAENRMLSTAPDHIDDLEQLVRRGRNHPSVFAWSLENEEFLEDTERGTRLLRRLRAIVRRLDPTRPTMIGADGLQAYELRTGYFDEVDIIGVHYRVLNRTMHEVHALRPDATVIADEEGLFPTVRGQYEDDHRRGLASAFGTSVRGLYTALPEFHAKRTGQPPVDYDIGATWQWFADHPETSGGFVWAGLDYFGEPTPIRWPVTVASYGAMDVCGFPKDYYWLLRSFFRPEPLVHVLPHWTWPGRDGERLRTWAYSNCDEVELFVNGRSAGCRPVVDHVAKWDDGVRYEPGTLSAIGRRARQPNARFTCATAGPPARLRVVVEPGTVSADGTDAAIVTVAVEDAGGALCPWAGDEISFLIDGPGEVIGVGNGDPGSLESHKGTRRRAFRGRCLAVVRATGEGEIRVTASSATGPAGTASFAARL